jgi:hypothetical protein
MRAYLSILRDSFREAFVSKALWAMLALIGLLLIVCACFGYKERTNTKFVRGDVIDARLIAARIIKDEDPTIVHIRGLIDEDDLSGLENIATPPKNSKKDQRNNGDFFRQLSRVTQVLNKLVEDEKTYDRDVWTSLPKSGELADLAAKDPKSLKTSEMHRRNRMLVERALREHLRYRPSERVAVTFVTFETPDTVALTKERLEVIIKTFVIPTILSVVVGIVGILFAVAITSPIIPRMYDQGALHLLLSKPVSRSLVFVTKFFGGCAFILFYISLLLTGLFLILGVRFEIWNTGLLWCIPVFVFSFSIFYSVSALAGAIWKNAIVSLAMTAVFWAGCTTVGVTYAIMKQMVDQSRIVRLTGEDDEFWAVREGGQVTVWDKESKKWLDFGGGRGNQLWLGPIEDKKNDRVIAASAFSAPFMAMTPRYEMFSSTEQAGWSRKAITALPNGSIGLFALPSGQPIVVTSSGVLALEDPAPEESEDEEDDEAEEGEAEEGEAEEGEAEKGEAEEGDESADGEVVAEENGEGGIGGFFGNLFGNKGPLKPMGPKERLKLSTPARAAMTPSGEIYLVDAARLVVLKLSDDGQFVVQRDVDFQLPVEEELDDDETPEPVVPQFIQATDTHVLMGTTDGDVLLYDAAKLNLLKRFRPLKWNDEPRFVFTSQSEEKFYLLNHGHTVQVVDADEQKFFEPNWPHQGEISAFRPLPKGKAAIVSTGDRVTILDIESADTDSEHVPNMPKWVWFFRSILSPVYRVFPRPGDLEQTVQYLTSQETSVNISTADIMGSARVTIDPWDPIRANLVFIVIMMIVSCLYIERQEL